MRQLTARISAVSGLHGPFRLEFFEDAAFAAETGKQWQDSLRHELEDRRISVTEDPAAPAMRVGLAETPTQIVLSASARVAEKDEVWLVTFSRASFRAPHLSGAGVRIEKQLIYESVERILDAAFVPDSAPNDLVLLLDQQPEPVVVRIDSAGAVRQSVSLSSAGALVSRDPRGELSLQSEGASVFLPGKSCQFAWTSPVEVKCRPAKSSWRAPVVLVPSCGAGSFKLLTDGADWTTPDLLQLVPENSAQRGSTAIVSDFPGPVVSINGGQDPAGALVVTHNLRTGNYEVYKITLACGN